MASGVMTASLGPGVQDPVLDPIDVCRPAATSKEELLALVSALDPWLEAAAVPASNPSKAGRGGPYLTEGPSSE